MFEAIPEEKMIREFVRQVAKQYDRKYWLAKAREGAFAEELWQEMGAGGYLGMMIPEEHGGGGLGLQSTGWSFRSITDSRNFTEMVAVQMVLQDSFTLTQYQYCERYAPSAPEKYMFRMAMQDKARHIAYGIAHLKYVLMHKPERRLELERY